MQSSSPHAEMHTGTVRSTDGTLITFERCGDGPPLILVVGAFNERSTGAPLAQYLAPDHTVFTYDRRGRGESSDSAPYAIEREIEDLQALIDEARGSAAVFGSTGPQRLVLAGELSPPPLQAAARTLAEEVPGAHYQPVAGVGHDLVPEALGPVVEAYLR